MKFGLLLRLGLMNLKLVSSSWWIDPIHQNSKFKACLKTDLHAKSVIRKLKLVWWLYCKVPWSSPVFCTGWLYKGQGGKEVPKNDKYGLHKHLLRICVCVYYHPCECMCDKRLGRDELWDFPTILAPLSSLSQDFIWAKIFACVLPMFILCGQFFFVFFLIFYCHIAFSYVKFVIFSTGRKDLWLDLLFLMSLVFIQPQWKNIF